MVSVFISTIFWIVDEELKVRCGINLIKNRVFFFFLTRLILRKTLLRKRKKRSALKSPQPASGTLLFHVLPPEFSTRWEESMTSCFGKSVPMKKIRPKTFQFHYFFQKLPVKRNSTF